ncbi:protein of unknown function DUF6, transmembrane [Verminephrobacter eiseniae EF01-2]|uniref:EamA domain-containing protein n=3 Tax=Verminephrobacter eiseniae TaxID=364317 RepID=A1WEY2_VEREI|nr:protein of unknown function DUF6, transmembrane [Verminephrobacter eiseniae EF01-2]MCW5286560.1 DMT family transporter [Verminephrobacter eiseniae]MCW5304859.1 DMT family transporter [Verminephrobacter eiseniae]MCW8178309.1 DMT family transporter [Verminephrobacter eiseniae]MCW8190029.1 DMT family transporter [Verminephrobacter eiseniae]
MMNDPAHAKLRTHAGEIFTGKNLQRRFGRQKDFTMQFNRKTSIGMGLALMAAFMNSFIAILSKQLSSANLNPSSIAFYRASIVFCIMLLVAYGVNVTRAGGRPEKPAAMASIGSVKVFAIAALFGLFGLFYFETSAYKYEMASNVVFVMMASAAISSLLLESSLKMERITGKKILALGASILGLLIVFDLAHLRNMNGVMLAMAAGTSYGLFSVYLRKQGVKASMHFMRNMFFFGAIYLAIPATIDGFSAVKPAHVPAILALAIVPSLLGTLCTMKSLEYLSASRVQTIELTEPIFVAIMAYLMIAETPGPTQMMGYAFILAGVFCMNSPDRTANT